MTTENILPVVETAPLTRDNRAQVNEWQYGQSDPQAISEQKGCTPMLVNKAAWLVAKQTKLQVKTAPYTPPRANEIVVKNVAVSINPIDWIKQCAGNFLFSWVKYPFVLGSDLAGEVVQVGSGVTRFEIGDRVLAHAVGVDKKRNSAAEGSFQEYTVVLDHMASPIPSSMSYESASVLPLALSTAACGLFQKDHLARKSHREVAKGRASWDN